MKRDRVFLFSVIRYYKKNKIKYILSVNCDLQNGMFLVTRESRKLFFVNR